MPWPIGIDELDPAGALTFVGMWRRGSHIDAAIIPIQGGVVDILRDAAELTLEQLGEREPLDFHAEYAEDPETYLRAARAQLPPDSEVLARVSEVGQLDEMSMNELRDRHLFAYAAVIGDQPENRIAFLRKANPKRGLERGHVAFLRIAGGALARQQTPTMVVDDQYDMVITADGVLALNFRAFDALFRDAPEALAIIPQRVHALAGHLPLAAGSAEALVDKAMRSVRVRRKVEAIVASGHLADVTVDMVEQELVDNGFDPEDWIENGELVITEDADVQPLLQVLNEDFFRGAFSSRGYRAERKTPRQ